MRITSVAGTLAALLVFSVCAPAAAQNVDGPQPPNEDRVALRACLDGASDLTQLRSCADALQERCWRSLPTRDLATTAQQRWCHYRSSLAWEGELEVTIGLLRDRLEAPGRAQLLAGQSAWQQALAADTAMAMSVIDDDAMRGAEGAGLRARAFAERVVFLEHVKLLAELNARAD